MLVSEYSTRVQVPDWRCSYTYNSMCISHLLRHSNRCRLNPCWYLVVSVCTVRSCQSQSSFVAGCPDRFLFLCFKNQVALNGGRCAERDRAWGEKQTRYCRGNDFAFSWIPGHRESEIRDEIGPADSTREDGRGKGGSLRENVWSGRCNPWLEWSIMP